MVEPTLPGDEVPEADLIEQHTTIETPSEAVSLRAGPILCCPVRHLSIREREQWSTPRARMSTPSRRRHRADGLVVLVRRPPPLKVRITCPAGPPR